MPRLDHRSLQDNNARQLTEADSAENRYFFALQHPHLGREPTFDELLMYYIENGGATGHRQRMEEHCSHVSAETSSSH